MGELWRSQKMQLVQLFIQKDAAHDTLEELGRLGKIQFRDLNSSVNSFQRNFVNEIKRCEEMERQLRYLEEQVHRENAEIARKEPEKKLSDYSGVDGKFFSEKSFDLNALEGHLYTLEHELLEMNSHRETIVRGFNELNEMNYVLVKDSTFFDEGLSKQGQQLEEIDHEREGSILGFTTGVVRKDAITPFERVLWRILRGNMIFKAADIEELMLDSATGELVEKVVFIIVHQGEQATAKVRKICESFGARLYNCPESPKQRREYSEQLKSRIDEISRVLARSNEHSRQLLAAIEKRIGAWVLLVSKEKAVFHTMNMFNYDAGRKLLIAEGWCPVVSTDDVLQALNRASITSGASVPSIMGVVRTRDEPPTFYPTNKFTACTHGIIEAYGVQRYEEVNPAVFSIITFPFLFAIMFGDAGHALIMLCAALAFIYFEKPLSKMKLNDILDMLFGGRYVLLLMAIFSIFTGLIYNDVFGLGIDLLGTAWHYDEGANSWVRGERIYEFGIDPLWKGSENELYFYNSFKMKLSVITGVIQMTLGIIMGLFNHLHFKKPLNIICEFIPQMIFMCGLFGYLVMLIYLKWATPLPHEPYLINVLIDMFLSFGNLPAEEKIYPGQNTVQMILAVAAVISVFVMLIPKPIVLMIQHKRAVAKLAATHKNLEGTSPPDHSSSHDHEEEFDFAEAVVHQSIHTIEFVLGCISNTASYLRLWALSLAHAELSLVFYEQVLLNTMKYNWFAVFVGFSVWGGATIAVLLIMEALSAFLHALRLHWVEFQNKFYNGDGYAFEPLDFGKLKSTLLEEQLGD
ncbi:vacuolar proton ATPase [Pelomyxa schiedti]|nr:vacuolar proton ATPase [Pelomyxa schiedti]